MQQVLATIVANTPILPGQNVMWFAAPEIAADISPGQFVMIRCGDAFDPFLRRPMSIHRIVTDTGASTTLDEPGFGLLIGVGGGATQWLAQQPVGALIDMLGPLGRGFEIAPNTKRLLLVGGGYGIAPLIGLAEQAAATGVEVVLLAGAQTASGAFPQELLPPAVRLETVTNDGTTLRSGLVTDHVAEFAGWADQICACGPVPMYRSLREVAHAAGFAGSVQVLMEEKMACGVGTCGACAVETAHGPALVCTEGPQFEVDELAL